MARSYLEWCETLKWRPFTHLGGYHTPSGVNHSHNHSISYSSSTIFNSFPFLIRLCLEFLLLVMLFLYAYGASFGSVMTTIDVNLVAISIPHCIPSISLYIDFFHLCLCAVNLHTYLTIWLSSCPVGIFHRFHH